MGLEGITGADGTFNIAAGASEWGLHFEIPNYDGSNADTITMEW